MPKFRSLATLAFAAGTTMLAGAVATPALAEYPEGPIEMVVPFGAGGGFDALGRSFAEALSGVLDVPVVIRNVPGAGGRAGSIELMRSNPDGYTIGFPHYVPFITDETLFGKASPIETSEFVKLGTVAAVKHFVYVSKSSEIMNLDDLAAVEGGPSFTNTDVGSNAWTHVMALATVKGFEPRFVHGYESLAEAALATIRGDAIGGVAGFAQVSGVMDDLRPIVYFHDKRSSSFPDTPTVVELGYPDFQNLASPYIPSTPPGIPDDVRAILEDAVKQVADDPEWHEWLESAGFVEISLDPDGTEIMLKSFTDIYMNIAPYVEAD